jgi:hypothetical protein
MKKMIILFTSLMVLVFFLPSQEIIQKPEKPLSSNAGRILKLEEMFRITDETGEFFFKWPSQLKIADDGSIFLADESQFLKFTSDGKFKKNIYKKGQGPGEIQSPFFSYHLQDEYIFIYDPTNVKIIFMDQEGELIEEFRLTERYFQFIGLQGENFILTKYVWPDIEVQTGKVIEIPAKILFISKEGDIINECLGIPMKRFLHQNLAVPVPQSAYIISGDGKVCFIYDEEEYMVSVVDLEKLEFIRKFKRDYARVKRPKSKTPSRSSMKAPEKKYENDIVWLYNFKGNLWIETSTGDDKKGTLYDVFNRAGQYIDSFWLSTNGFLIATHEDYLFVREQDEEGSLSIVKYRVLQ